MENDDTAQPAAGRGRAIRQADAGMRSFLIRRQNAIHATLMGVGIHFGVRSMLGEPSLVSEAAAFIMVGGVGLIMSLTSMDIGQSLKEAVREEGDKTRAVLETMGKRMEERDKRIEERLEGIDKRMEERDKRIEESLDRMSTAIETLARESSGIFKHMLETQNRILEKMS